MADLLLYYRRLNLARNGRYNGTNRRKDEFHSRSQVLLTVSRFIRRQDCKAGQCIGINTHLQRRRSDGSPSARKHPKIRQQ